jgi:hypothetical protein
MHPTAGPTELQVSPSADPLCLTQALATVTTGESTGPTSELTASSHVSHLYRVPKHRKHQTPTLFDQCNLSAARMITFDDDETFGNIWMTEHRT